MPDPSRPPRSNAPRSRRVLVVLMVATVGLGTLWVAPPAGAQDDVAIAGTASATWPVPIGEMLLSKTPAAMDTPLACSVRPVTENDAPEPPGFTFLDGPTERACGFAEFTFERPFGVDRFAVEFEADREVNGTQTAAFQKLYLTDQEGNGFAEFAYYDSAALSKPMQAFGFEFDVPRNLTTLALNWTFADGGTPLVIHNELTRASATNFSATVQRPQLKFTDIPLEPGRTTTSFVTEANGTRITTTNATIHVPDLLRAPDDTGEVSLRLVNPDRLVGITSPRGLALNLSSIEALAEGTQVTIVLDTEILRNMGPGAYTFTFQRTETLPAPAAPAPPATIFPLVYLLSLLPAPTAAYAYTQVWRVRRVSEGLGRAGGLYIGAAALTLAYLGLLGFLYFSGRLRSVATLPVGTEGIFVFAGFVVLAVAFILLGALVARSVLRSLKRDLAERRRIQKELERSNQELEHFAYVASHDLQEPLRTISGFSQLLKKRYEGELDERAIRYITRTVEGTDRMSRLIHDLLEYSRVDSRGRPLEPTDLNKLVDDVRQDLETLIESSGARVTADHLPTVQADPTQLAQVLSNLVRNSIKYHHPDRAPEVHVSSSQQDGAWMISVTDNGVGIPKDQQERAFVIFQRLVPRETDDTGTGLGLAISRKIVERHAGQIWVESDGASGSTFRFTLPRDASVGMNGAGPKPKRKVKARRQRGNRAPA